MTFMLISENHYDDGSLMCDAEETNSSILTRTICLLHRLKDTTVSFHYKL